jgi:hypothetical protein
VTELPGSSPHIRYSDKPVVQIVVYSNEGRDSAKQRSYKILADLADAHSKTYTVGGYHHISVLVRPSHQDVSGQPYDVARVVSQIQLGLSNLAKWHDA